MDAKPNQVVSDIDQEKIREMYYALHQYYPSVEEGWSAVYEIPSSVQSLDHEREYIRNDNNDIFCNYPDIPLKSSKY